MSENVQKKKDLFAGGMKTLKGMATEVGAKAQQTYDGAKEYAKNTAIPSIQKASTNAKDFALKTKNQAADALDVNNDGTVDIQDIIILGFRTPGIRINRDEFLKKEFSKNYSNEVIEKAIKETPANAGIPPEDINKMVDETIKFERNCVSGISAALGVPGGVAAVATTTADIGQYYGYMLRAAQKMMYLYGFPQIDTNENEAALDTGTMNTLILCLGVMFGVQGANAAIKAMAKGLANGVSKKLLQTALTKGTLYPMIKDICKWFSVNMTKKMLSQIVKSAIPVIGGVVGGTITYISFKPCCDRLKESLKDTYLSNPHHVETEEEKTYIIDSESVETEGDF